MLHLTQSAFNQGTGVLRLDTLIRLRWLAVAGQLAALVVTSQILGFRVPILPFVLALAASAVLNLVLRSRFAVSYRLSDRAASALLAFDVVQLAVLLYLTGGLENPFALLFLAPVMISATVLPPRQTLMIGIIVVISATIIGFYYLPLPWFSGETFALPLLYRLGSWFAILLGVAFIGVYAWRVAEEARQLAEALSATELVLAREQHLTQIDGLAAAAAHELGTPLATIALVAKELEKTGPQDGLIGDDIRLLVQQVSRCREILKTLNSLGHEEAGPLGMMTLGLLLEEVIAPQRSFGIDLEVIPQGAGDEPRLRRNPAILYGLGNLVENAVDFASEAVLIEALWDDQRVTIRISDDGPGFSPEILARLGEPYVTSRIGPRRTKSEGESGLGLGLFIAKTLLERSGATLAFSNALKAERGARVSIFWPRDVFTHAKSA